MKRKKPKTPKESVIPNVRKRGGLDPRDHRGKTYMRDMLRKVRFR